MARCVCGAPAPALDEGLGQWRTITDLDVFGVVALLTGELDHARCDAGCWLNVRATIVFKDSDTGRRYVVLGDRVDPVEMVANVPSDLWVSTELVADLEELRRIVGGLVDRRARIFLPAISGGLGGVGGIEYLDDNWRLFTAPVMAAVRVSLTGRVVPAIGFAGPAKDIEPAERQEKSKRHLEECQAVIWSSMLIDWTNGEGVGSFEEDLTQYVDQTSLLGDPLWFVERLDHLSCPPDEEVARMDTFRREALRASLYARVGKPNPLAGFWAVVWLWWELRLRVAGGGGVAEVPALAVSNDRVRRTVPPDAARHAGVMLVTQELEMGRGDSPAELDGKSSMAHLRDVFLEFGFADQVASLFTATRLGGPIEKVADGIIAALGADVSLVMTQGMAQALVDERRVYDLKRVVDAMLVAHPAYALSVRLWYYRKLFQMRMPKRLLEEAGEAPPPDEERFPAAAQGELLQLRVLALRALGRLSEALTLLDSAAQEMLDEPTNKQGLVIARARLVRELGSPATALAQLEALLAEVADPDPHLHESYMATLLQFGRYREAVGQGRAAYTGALRDWMRWPVGRFAAQTILCQAMDGSEPDADLVGPATGENQPADPERDLLAANALLIYGVAKSDIARLKFLDRVRTESAIVLEQALAEQDVRTAFRALYVAALYDQTYRPNEALESWSRLVSVISDEFGTTPVEGRLYMAANLIFSGETAPAQSLLKDVLGAPEGLGHDSRLQTAALAGTHTAREIDLVTAAMFAEPGATQADLRLVGELRRGMASRAIRREGEDPAWRKHGLDDEVVAGIAPDHGRVGVLEWMSDGADTHALITVVDAAGSVSGTTVALPDVDLGRVATRMRSRLSTWRAGRPGDPFGVAEWQICRTWLDRLLDDHLAPDDHLVVVPFAGWRQLPWHVAAFDRVTCSYEPSWVALLSTVAGEPLPECLSEGVAAVPRVGDPAEVTEAMARYVAGCGDGVRVLDGVGADRDAVTDLLANVDLVTLLTHGYTSAAESEVALMLAADGSLPLAHSVAASSERGRAHRFGWREYAELAEVPRVILSAACGTGGGHIVGLGEHLGLYNVLRQVGLRAYVAPQWDIMASDLLPILGDIRARLLAREAGLGQCVRQAVRQAIHRGIPAWSAHALILEGDWH